MIFIKEKAARVSPLAAYDYDPSNEEQSLDDADKSITPTAAFSGDDFSGLFEKESDQEKLTSLLNELDGPYSSLS